MMEKDAAGRFSLSRWSRRKVETQAEVAAPASAAPASAASAAPSSAAPASSAPPAPEPPELDSLTFDSDFTAFLRPEVDETLKRAALKRLFRDPRFNVMDGLDVYIDDYTKADPIPPDMVKDLLQRGFTAITSASQATSLESPGSPKADEAVPAPAAPQALPPTAVAAAASSLEPPSPELTDSAPDPSSTPRSPL